VSGPGDTIGRTWRLLGADGDVFQSAVPGTLGGNAKGHIYGRLDCPSALRAVRQGGYIEHRVFFLDAPTAVRAGYRPCGTCLREDYRRWRDDPEAFRRSMLGDGTLST
jgi:hypothetical protein